MESLSPDEKRVFVNSFVDRIYVEDEEIVMIIPSRLTANWLAQKSDN